MAVSFKEVNYTYQPHTPFENQALFDINFDIPDGSYTAIIGHTGSGKSTIIQHINGLLKPTTGTVIVNKLSITKNIKNKQLTDVRKRVGMVFQFPESQLFADTILDDVKFGPLNFGMEDELATKNAELALQKVGIDKQLWQRSPFELSGGQMRRVAIAGVIAAKPEVLVLDEPTAGLDPQSRTEMMQLFKELHESERITLILITHQMNDVANFADHVLIVDDGKIVKNGSPSEVFDDHTWLQKHQLDLPKAAIVAHAIDPNQQYLDNPLTLDDLVNQIVKAGVKHE